MLTVDVETAAVDPVAEYATAVVVWEGVPVDFEFVVDAMMAVDVAVLTVVMVDVAAAAALVLAAEVAAVAVEVAAAGGPHLADLFQEYYLKDI